MTLQRFKDVVALPAVIVGGLLAIWTVFSWIDGLVTQPELGQHLKVDTIIHSEQFKSMKELDSHAEEQSELVKAIVRGECIENPRDNLARQGLLPTCTKLGIVR